MWQVTSGPAGKKQLKNTVFLRWRNHLMPSSLECEKRGITLRCGEFFPKNRSPIPYVTKIQCAEISGWVSCVLLIFTTDNSLLSGRVWGVTKWAGPERCSWAVYGDVKQAFCFCWGLCNPISKYKRLSAPPSTFEKLNLFLALLTLWRWFNLNWEIGGK